LEDLVASYQIENERSYHQLKVRMNMMIITAMPELTMMLVMLMTLIVWEITEPVLRGSLDATSRRTLYNVSKSKSRIKEYESCIR
jgi:hypothetical protein